MEKELIKKLRQQYIQNPPEGMSPKDIRNMDYFLHEDVDLDEHLGEEGFYIF